MAKDIPLNVTVKEAYTPQATTGKLILGLFLDAMGLVSYLIPGLGEIFDIVWAPIGAFAMTLMYKGTVGKVAGLVEFLEEIEPGFMDFIPTFTLTWLYEYYQDKKYRK